MAKTKQSAEGKQKELDRLRKIIIAMIDYSVEEEERHRSNPEMINIYTNMKSGLEENYSKSRLTILKNWHRDIAEPFVATRNSEIYKYIFDKTGLKVNLFESFLNRIAKIIESGVIRTENQYYDVKEMIDSLSPDFIDQSQLEVLYKLMQKFEDRAVQKSLKK